MRYRNRADDVDDVMLSHKSGLKGLCFSIRRSHIKFRTQLRQLEIPCPISFTGRLVPIEYDLPISHDRRLLFLFTFFGGFFNDPLIIAI